MPSSEYTHMRIEDKDEKGEGYLAIESKEDLEEFRKMLIEAYYELNPDRKRPEYEKFSKSVWGIPKHDNVSLKKLLNNDDNSFGLRFNLKPDNVNEITYIT